MTGLKIQSDERGITITKSLAWTMMVGLVALGVSAGNSLGGLKTGLEQVAKDIAEEKTDTETGLAQLRNEITLEREAGDQLRVRLRALEVFKSSTVATMDGLGRSLEEMKEDNREQNRLLRNILTRLDRQ